MKNVEDIYSLTPAQQGMLFHTLYAPESGVYVEHLRWTLKGSLDVQAFKRAWQGVLDRHQILRSAFFIEGLDEPIQVVRQNVKVPLELYDWRGCSGTELEEKLKDFLQADRRRGFELSKAPLMRVSLMELADDEYFVIWSHHHMLLDGWSVSLVLKEVFLLYASFTLGDGLSLGQVNLEQAPPYRDYIGWIKRQQESEAELFWRNLLAGFDTPTPLPVARPADGPAAEDRPDMEEVFVSAEATAALQSMARQRQLTLNTIVQGAWALLLSHYSGEPDVVFGSIVSGRPTGLPQVESMVGLFLNALPVRVSVPPQAPLKEWLQNIQAQQATAREFQYSSLNDIQSWSDVPRGSQLFNSTLAFENFPVANVLQNHSGEIEVLDYVRYGSRSNYPINVVVEPGKQLALQIGYDRRVSEAEAIKGMLRHFRAILEGMAANPDARLSELSLLTESERRQLLYDWNQTATDTSRLGCAHRLFEEQAARTPDAIALVFEGETLSYGQLNARANQLAHYLKSMSVGPEMLVGICVEPSLDMIVGAFGVLKAGAAYLPLDPAYPLDRLDFMLRDARVMVLLTQERLLDQLPAHWAQVICLDSDWSIIAAQDTENIAGGAAERNLAYVIYTSGSTGEPKGVMVEHRSLCNLALAQIEAFQIGAASRVLQFASLSFDASASEIFTALLAGASLHLGGKQSLLPGASLLSTLRDNRVTVATFPPSALSIMRNGDVELPDLQTIVSAGEACPAEVVARWGEGRRFLNAYGPTEATVCATIAECDSPTRTPPIGRPISNVRAYLLNAYLHPVPVGVPGELYVGGLSLARGYLNRPELTAERFIPDQFGSVPGGRLYKAGDLTSYLPDGEIQFHGRVDNQVKVRGFRIESGEVEAALLLCTGVCEAVVVAREDDPGDKRLVAYLVCEQGLEPVVDELRRSLQERLPDYMIPSAFEVLSELPLTPSGKVDRLALQAPSNLRPRLGQAYLPPRDEVEEVLAGIWAQALGLERVGIEDSFFSLGGDSIRGLQVLSQGQECGWKFTLAQLFELQTIRALAEMLKAEHLSMPALQSHPFELISYEDRLKLPEDAVDAYPLSKLQNGMLFQVESRPDTAIYQSMITLHLRANLDDGAFKKAVEQVIRRHPILRTSFELYKFSEPIQVVYREVDVPFEVEDISHLGVAQQQQLLSEWFEAERQRHFDWARPPLIRFTIHRRSKESFQFTIVASHTIMDGWSDGLLLMGLSKYHSQLLKGGLDDDPPPSLTFRDYVALERSVLESAECSQYWGAKLAGSSITRLPRWSSTRAGEAKEFGKIELAISPELSKEVIKIASTNTVSLKNVLLAAHLKVMSLLTGQSDIVTGLVSSVRPEGRNSDKVIGLFLNTIPFRFPIQDGSWVDMIKAIFAAEMEFMPYRFYPLAQIQLDHGGKPMFETCFNFTHFHNYQGSKLHEELEVLGIDSVTETDFALLVYFSLDPYSSALTLSLDYDARELSDKQAEAIAGYYLRTLEAMANDPFEQHQHHSLLSAQERQQMIEGWNQTRRDYPLHETVAGLLQAQAERSPDAIAVACADKQISYAELDRQSNRVARYLKRLGVGPEVMVGICMERSIEMVVGLLGILKAGGAYVPLDPAYPHQRLSFMIDDARVALLLAQESSSAKLTGHEARLVCLDTEWPRIAEESAESLPDETLADNLAYVIYTSGSTGKPKGVKIPHRALTNFLYAMRRQPGLSEQDVLLSVTTLSFDIAGLELYLPLTVGGRTHLVSREVATDGIALRKHLDASAATVMQATPSTWRMLIEAGWEGGARLSALCGGEALPCELAQKLAARSKECWNLYGPTETTIWSAQQRVELDPQLVPIGRPISNTQIYLLDARLELVPVGVSGELYIGGDGLARGYLNRPELTAEKFIPDPFSSEAGRRLYRTGDLARYLADGVIECLGRQDQQVKIRGFRVEMGEIEEAMLSHPAIRQCAVSFRDDGSISKQLVAYLVWNEGETGSADEAREFLKQRLPDYMVPSFYLALEELPLTISGKLDRLALPAPDLNGLGLRGAFVAPRTRTEELVAGIWSAVLGLERVSVDSDFFDLGGHSLMVTRILSRVREVFEVEVPLMSLIQEPTVAGLAQCIDMELPLKEAARTAPTDGG